jgi:DNA mismatch repair ATPase MutS
MAELEKTYLDRIYRGEKQIKQFKRMLAVLSLLRLVSFILIIAFPVLFYSVNALYAIILSVFSLAFFLFSLKKFQEISLKMQFEQKKVEINKLEVEALQHDFSNFNDGSAYIDPNHFNSYDLDVFGKGSLFQFLNRTVTPGGSELLAKMLTNPITACGAIESRQKLIDELVDNLNWRQNFAATGKMHTEDENDPNLLTGWGADSFSLRSGVKTPVIIITLTLLSFATLLVWIFSGNIMPFLLSGFLQTGFWLYEKKNINDLYSKFGKRVKLFEKYAGLFLMIEKYEWKSEEGKALREALKNSGLPSAEFFKLKKIIEYFEQRNNMLAGALLNLMLAWDVMCSYRIVVWHRRNKDSFALWSRAVSLIDAILSFSNFSFNNPGFKFPEPVSADFFIEATSLGHPLIHPHKRVDNNFQFQAGSNIIIVTGANMSGKSTFLRTVGVNLLLAMCGAPVCAASMRFKPVEVFSNMRTTDSLFDDESYFFAELKRIKLMLDQLISGREMLIILDEILKGTNSVDKLSGSQKLIRRLIDQNAKAIIATHDLKLTDMEGEYPVKIQNRCFEIEIENNEMHFDYKLRPGTTSIMNATFLMQKMGIV